MPLKDYNEHKMKMRLYYYKNREKRITQQRKWDKDNKYKKRIYDKKRREEKEDNKIKSFNHYSRKHHYPILIERYKGCQLCDSKDKLEIHHIRYSKDIRDVLLLCQECHKKIHRKYG